MGKEIQSEKLPIFDSQKSTKSTIKLLKMSQLKAFKVDQTFSNTLYLLSSRRVQGFQAWTIALDSLLEDQAWATHDEQSVTWHHLQLQQTQQPGRQTKFLNSVIKYPSESGWEN